MTLSSDKGHEYRGVVVTVNRLMDQRWLWSAKTISGSGAPPIDEQRYCETKDEAMNEAHKVVDLYYKEK